MAHFCSFYLYAHCVTPLEIIWAHLSHNNLYLSANSFAQESPAETLAKQATEISFLHIDTYPLFIHKVSFGKFSESSTTGS